MAKIRSKENPDHEGNRGGFGLTEVIVVIAILAILMAFLGPALLQAKDTANHVGNLNKMKNNVLAIRNYVDTNGSYPVDNIPTTDSRTNLGHRTPSLVNSLLPYLEQSNVSNKYNNDEWAGDPDNLKLAQQAHIPSLQLEHYGHEDYSGGVNVGFIGSGKPPVEKMYNPDYRHEVPLNNLTYGSEGYQTWRRYGGSVDNDGPFTADRRYDTRDGSTPVVKTTDAHMQPKGSSFVALVAPNNGRKASFETIPDPNTDTTDFVTGHTRITTAAQPDYVKRRDQGDIDGIGMDRKGLAHIGYADGHVQRVNIKEMDSEVRKSMGSVRE